MATCDWWINNHGVNGPQLVKCGLAFPCYKHDRELGTSTAGCTNAPRCYASLHVNGCPELTAKTYRQAREEARVNKKSEQASPDMVNEPPHYRGVTVRGKRVRVPEDMCFADGSVRSSVEIEAVDVIEGLQLGYHLGTVLKYLWRAGKKGPALEDLRKAKWFLERKIAKLEAGK